LGADRIVPMATERGVVKLDAARIKIDRLRRAAIEASKQCGRNRITTIDDPRALPAVLAESAAFSLRLRPDVAGAVALRTALPAAPPPSVLALVGPEGGFTEGERALADEAVSLGRSVCRVATACLALAAVLATAWPVECNGSFDTAP
jgi:16S rRNA (uracil1498-N3)-methyltransferase